MSSKKNNNEHDIPDNELEMPYPPTPEGDKENAPRNETNQAKSAQSMGQPTQGAHCGVAGGMMTWTPRNNAGWIKLLETKGTRRRNLAVKKRVTNDWS